MWTQTKNNTKELIKQTDSKILTPKKKKEKKILKSNLQLTRFMIDQIYGQQKGKCRGEG